MGGVRQPLTRESVIAAARHLLVEGGLEAVSLRRVARALDVTAPALYAHVQGKRDLLQAIAEQEFERLLARFEADASFDPLDRIRRMSRTYVEYARDNPELFQAMFLFRPELTAEPRGDELPLATKVFEEGASAAWDAIDRGLFAPVDARLAALTVWAAVHGVATVLLSGPDLPPAVEAALLESVVETVVSGLVHGPVGRSGRPQATA